MELTQQMLHKALTAVGELLAYRKEQSFHLVVCGGSALIAAKTVTRATNDVDVLASLNYDREVSMAYPLPAPLSRAVKDVAAELELKENWLNGNASFLFPDLAALPQWLWHEVDRHDFGGWLRVDFISRRGQILLKTYAVLNREEPRDLQDLEALAPDAGETAAAVRWVLRTIETLEHRDRLPDLLQHLGHEELLSELKG